MVSLQGESGEELSPVPSDWLPDLLAGQRTSVCSTGSEDAAPAHFSRQLSGSECTSVSEIQRVLTVRESRRCFHNEPENHHILKFSSVSMK